MWEKLLKEFLINSSCYNYQPVKLAVLSIMWKAHITTNEGFKHLKLGPHAEKIYELIKSEKITKGEEIIKEEDFPIWINRYQPQNQKAAGDVLQTMVLPGRLLRGDYGIRFWMFAFLGYQVIVKVDNQQLPCRYTQFIKVAAPNIGILPYISSSSLTSSMQEVFLLLYVR